MAIRTLPILAVAVLLTSAVYAQKPLFSSQNDVSRCDNTDGVRFYNPRWLCEKNFYANYITGDATFVTCGVGKATCNSNGTVTVITKTYVNGTLTRSSVSLLSGLSHGKVDRQYDTSPGQLTLREVTYSHTEYQDGQFKKVFQECSSFSNNNDKVKLIFISSGKNTEFTSELEELRNEFPQVKITAIENLCDVDKIFP